MRRVLIASILAIAIWTAPAVAQTKDDYLVYLGTYTQSVSKGIYEYRFNSATGALTPIGLAVETPSPSFLVLHPNSRFLYAANEGDDAVSSFEIDKTTGKLRFLNKVSSEGKGPCHVSIDKAGTTLFVANYGNGSIAAISIGPDGRLGRRTAFDQHHGSSVNKDRQAGPHAHFISPSPDGKFVLTADLGLDQVLVYRYNPSSGTLQPNAPPFGTLKPGSGPRHLAFHPNGRIVYVNGEMSSTVSAFSYDADKGTLKEIQTVSSLPKGFTANNSTAEIQVDRTGHFLYVSNRGQNTVAVFTIAGDGTLTFAGYGDTNGRTPRFFTLDPSGKYMFAANQDSNTLIEYDVKPTSGWLLRKTMIADAPEPVCLVFVPITR